MDTYKEHLDQRLIDAGARFVRDIETLDRANVICSRAYTGMPFAMSRFDLGDEQAQSLAFIRWFEKTVDPRFVAAAAWLVIGIRPETAPASDWAVKTSRYTGRDAKGVWTASSLKWTLVRLDEAYRAYAAHMRFRKGQIEAKRIRETHVKPL